MTNDHERDTNVPEAQAAEATEDRRDFVKKSLVIAGAAGAALVGAGCSDAQAAPGVPGDASPDAIKKAAAGYAEESLPTAADQVACDECRFAVDGACSRFEFPINTQAGSCEQGSPVGVRGAVELLMRYVRIHDLPTRTAADSCANCDNNVSGVCSAASLLYEALDATGEVQVDEHTSCEKLRRVTSAREHFDALFLFVTAPSADNCSTCVNQNGKGNCTQRAWRAAATRVGGTDLSVTTDMVCDLHRPKSCS